jgi:hypothetical protein
MSSHPAAMHMQTKNLAHHCAQQTQRFFNRQNHDDGYCFELFRRAMVLKAEDAWQHLYSQYRSLTAGWVQGHSLFSACEEEGDYFVNEAFFRMARACTPEKFPRFTHLAQLLTYLKACVHGAVTDHYESKVAPYPEGLLIDEVAGEPMERSVQEEVLDREQRHALWDALQARLNGEKEFVVLESFFLIGLKPREIYAAHRQTFADQEEVYQIKGNLLRRLRRDRELQRFLSHRD